MPSTVPLESMLLLVSGGAEVSISEDTDAAEFSVEFSLLIALESSDAHKYCPNGIGEFPGVIQTS